jgi:methyl-accepting chemotaxis protein
MVGESTYINIKGVTMKGSLKKLSLSYRLILTSVIPVLLISLILGGLGYFNNGQLSGIIQEIVSQRVPVLKSLSTLEKTTSQLINDQSSMISAVSDSRMDMEIYQQAVLNDITAFSGTLDELDKIASQNKDKNILENAAKIREDLNQYKDLYNSVLSKIEEQNSASSKMQTYGNLVINLANSFMKEAVSKDEKDSISVLLDVLEGTNRSQVNQSKYMLVHDPKYWTEAENEINTILPSLEDLLKVTEDKTSQRRINDIKKSTTAYYEAAKLWNRSNDELQSDVGKMNTLSENVKEKVRLAEDDGWKSTEESKIRSDNIIRQSILLNVLSILIAILIGVVLGVFLPRGIIRPIKAIERASKNIADGDIDQIIEIDSEDEIGNMARSFQSMIIYLEEMAAVVVSISKGDLTVDIQPRSEKDLLGNSLKTMVVSLRDAINLVSTSARDLDKSSAQLAESAVQASSATNQISTTVQQVAVGTSQQAEYSTKTSELVEKMSTAMGNVERGAKEQGTAAAKAAELTASLSEAIQQVEGNAAAVTRDSNQASEAAKDGTGIVKSTIEGMNRIQSKVGVSAQKVQEMGNRSKQIGAIVETIDDIASQTNLLALNAAIEAARAGEHGKGFAVVADEVRKLAERSSVATKEIGQLIKGIQQTVDEAVKAMNEGASEVQNGVELANESGKALANILSAAEAVQVQARQATEAALRMNKFSEELVRSVDEVAKIAEVNSMASDEMKTDSDEVTRAIENIASVSEENSAAIEQVSASTEEMSAQVEDVTGSAKKLTETAGQLIAMVARFKLNEN